MFCSISILLVKPYWGWAWGHQGWGSPPGPGTGCCHSRGSSAALGHTCTATPGRTSEDASLTRHDCKTKSFHCLHLDKMGLLLQKEMFLTMMVTKAKFELNFWTFAYKSWTLTRPTWHLQPGSGWTSRRISTVSPPEWTEGWPSRPEWPVGGSHIIPKRCLSF